MNWMPSYKADSFPASEEIFRDLRNQFLKHPNTSAYTESDESSQHPSIPPLKYPF